MYTFTTSHPSHSPERPVGAPHRPGAAPERPQGGPGRPWAAPERPGRPLAGGSPGRWAALGRHVFAAVRIYRGVQFKIGRLTRFFSSGRYAKKYNFDVLFVGEQGPRGMYLERDAGENTKHDALAATNAIEGTWFFLQEL